MMRCSIWAWLTPGPAKPLTVSVLPLSCMSAVTYAFCVVVSPASMPLKEMLTLSPGRMSGVTFRPVPAPQQ